jgi:signal peptidase I
MNNLEGQIQESGDRKYERSVLLKPETRQGHILMCLALWSTIAFLFIHRFIVSAVVVDGRSMLPTLFPGQQCIVNGWLPHFRDYQRGDLVVIRDDVRGELMVKRIVGLPNEQLLIKNGRVLVNGVPLVEPYLSAATYTDAREHPLSMIQLSKTEYFVLGDNRALSEDSRFYGPIDRSQLMGLITH